MIYWMYYLASSTDPGAVPKGWLPNAMLFALEAQEIATKTHPDMTSKLSPKEVQSPEKMSESSLLKTRDSSTLVVQRKRSSNKPYRYCKRCQVYKPPRTHHCSICGTCVLRMDHHCPWIGTCVGYYNHAHFFRFLVWTAIASISFLATCVYKFIDMMEVYELIPLASGGGRWSIFQVMVNLFNIVLLAIVLIAILFIMFQHFWGFCKNMTLIERLEMDEITMRIEYLKKRRDPLAVSLMGRKLYPYDLGLARNLASFMGERKFLRWFFPLPVRGDGIHYEVADWVLEAAEAHINDEKPFLIEWPPRLDDEYEAEDTTNAHIVEYEQDEEGFVVSDEPRYPMEMLPSPRFPTDGPYTHTYPSRDARSVDWYLRKTAQMQRSKTTFGRGAHSSVSLGKKSVFVHNSSQSQ